MDNLRYFATLIAIKNNDKKLIFAIQLIQI